MKPKNFPGRKNDRRIAVRDRRSQDMLKYVGENKNETKWGIAAIDVAALNKRIESPDTARLHRTKKDRSSQAKLTMK